MNDPVGLKKDLLDDLQEEVVIIPVSKGIRFANYLLDQLCVYALCFGTVFVIAFLQALNGRYDETQNNYFIVLAYGIVVLYYTVLEGLTGRTIGKFITGTRVYRFDGQPLTWKDAFLRSLSRLVPFEPFSALGDTPWHDHWTSTTVGRK